MSRIDTAQIMTTVDQILAAREELLARGLPAGDVLVIVGCALGVQLSGGHG
jgi:hypothetical protein